MTLADSLTWITRVVFVLIFVATAAEAVRRPRRANIDVALFFGSIALAVLLTVVTQLLGEPVRAISIGAAVVAVSLPLMLFRIVDDFISTSRAARWAIWAGCVASIGPVVLLHAPYPPIFTLWILAYCVAALAYSTARFGSRIRVARGGRRRRKQAVAAGSILLAGSILFSALAGLIPVASGALRATGAVGGLACALAYFVGFAPPLAVRRLWQESGVQRFLGVIASVQAATTVELAGELEPAVAEAMGAEHALITLWSDAEARLRAPSFAQPALPPTRANSSATFEVFRSQRPMFVDDMVSRHPENADVYERLGMRRAMIAPLTFRNRRLGVVTVYGFDAPLFPEDDLAVLAVLGGQIALLFALRENAEQAASAAARAETLKLQEEFLGAAAHDLRTPLTMILGEAQLLQRRLRREAPPPPELEEVDILVTQAQRMRRLTEDVLNVMRDAGGFIGERKPTDLRVLAEEVAAATNSGGYELHVEGAAAIAPVDVGRTEQVIANLLDNAVKFSPKGGAITVTLADRPDEVEVTVGDHGVGIEADDLTRIFDRFTRGSTAMGTAPGAGLGLFICKRIVEEHGGRIWAESEVGRGSRFHVVFPKRVE